MERNIPLVHWGQLSLLCPLPASLSPPAHSLQGHFSSACSKRAGGSSRGRTWGAGFWLCISDFQQKAGGRKGESKCNPGLLIGSQGLSLHVVSSPPQHYSYPHPGPTASPTTPPVGLPCHGPTFPTHSPYHCFCLSVSLFQVDERTRTPLIFKRSFTPPASLPEGEGAEDPSSPL